MTNKDEKLEGHSSLLWDTVWLKERIVCYKMLFNGDDDDFKAVVDFEPGFFALFQLILTEDIVIRIVKLLDRRPDVISLKKFTETYLDGAQQKELTDKLLEIVNRANTIIRLRHEWIAHKNHELAIGKKEIEKVNVSDLEEVAKMIDTYFYNLSRQVFPNGVIGSDGVSIAYLNEEHAKDYTTKLLTKIKKLNVIENRRDSFFKNIK